MILLCCAFLRCLCDEARNNWFDPNYHLDVSDGDLYIYNEAEYFLIRANFSYDHGDLSAPDMHFQVRVNFHIERLRYILDVMHPRRGYYCSIQ